MTLTPLRFFASSLNFLQFVTIFHWGGEVSQCKQLFVSSRLTRLTDDPNHSATKGHLMSLHYRSLFY